MLTRAINRSTLSVILSVILSIFFVTALAHAATTIGTNVNTGGTLTVTGTSTFGDNITVPAAYGLDTAAAGALNIGTSTTTSLTIADAGVLTTIRGTLNVDEAVTFDATLGVTGVATFSSNFTLDNSATSTVTMTNGLNFDSNTFVVDPNANRVGVLTATPNTDFEVVGTASSTSLIVGGNSTNGTIAGIVFGTCTYNPAAAITASSTLSTNCTGATGVQTTDRVFMTPRSLENNLIFTSASSTASDVIQVSVYNTGVTGDITPASATWDWMAIR